MKLNPDVATRIPSELRSSFTQTVAKYEEKVNEAARDQALTPEVAEALIENVFTDAAHQTPGMKLGLFAVLTEGLTRAVQTHELADPLGIVKQLDRLTPESFGQLKENLLYDLGEMKALARRWSSASSGWSATDEGGWALASSADRNRVVDALVGSLRGHWVERGLLEKLGLERDPAAPAGIVSFTDGKVTLDFAAESIHTRWTAEDLRSLSEVLKDGEGYFRHSEIDRLAQVRRQIEPMLDDPKQDVVNALLDPSTFEYTLRDRPGREGATVFERQGYDEEAAEVKVRRIAVPSFGRVTLWPAKGEERDRFFRALANNTDYNHPLLARSANAEGLLSGLTRGSYSSGAFEPLGFKEVSVMETTGFRLENANGAVIRLPYPAASARAWDSDKSEALYRVLMTGTGEFTLKS